MIKFIRHRRKEQMEKGKTGKYLKYAIGEIVLVVVGILIALSINNWNTFRVNNNLADGYRQDLIDELKVDLKSIDSLNKKTTRTQNDIKHYLKILNQEPVNMDSIKITLKNLSPVVYWFNSSSYSIDELITTGNISLLNKAEKNSILKLKKTFEINMEYIREASRFWTNLLDREKESMDHLYFSGFSSKEHISVKNWMDNLNSDQYRYIHNRLAESLRLYDYQLQLRGSSKKVIQETINELKNNIDD